jgi:hypothetical protein
VSRIPDSGSVAGDIWSLDPLPVSGTATLIVTLTAGANAAAGAGVVAGAASITAVSGALVETGDDSDGDTTSLAREVDLQLTQTESVDPVRAGTGPGNLVYEITLFNAGPSDASGLSIDASQTLPLGVTLDGVAPSAGTYAAPTWSLASLGAGSSATLTVTLDVTGAAAPGIDTITSLATITSANEPLLSTGDDSTSESTSIVPPALFEDDFESGDTSAWSVSEPP